MLPREKLRKFGSEYLELYELFSIIFNIGDKKESILDFSKRIIKNYNLKNIVKFRNVNDLKLYLNISEFKASQLLSIIEIGKRIFSENKIKINSSEKIFRYFKNNFKDNNVNVVCVYLNKFYEILDEEVIYLGNSFDLNNINLENLFKKIFTLSINKILIVKINIFDKAEPNEKDFKIYRKINFIFKNFNLEFLDYIIMNNEDYFSFNDKDNLINE